ncbi:Hsp20/alpha crystallin family protein [Danxiaibacter flavus]|uniref:Hsp20/alpha crystallin family protein n=1 Tax=Danxiaibacter flavus TaxID=3049108 RepID=A0ABV3ZQ24_9BACT|nr:Hsp20/alpha crystallin family protein [Chitinophagaceae bacterium DXS]
MKDTFIYPGEYVPLNASGMLAENEAIKAPGKAPINLIEKDCCFEIELAVPGVKKEDIKIYCYNNILSIQIPPVRGDRQRTKILLQDFEKGNLFTKVVLPVDADSQFMTAELKDGILVILVPKNVDHVCQDIERLIVY